MNSEKIFWGIVAVLTIGMFLFLAFGWLVAPVSAAQQGFASPQYRIGAGAPSAASPPSGSQLAPVKGGVQEVALSVQGSSYMPNPIRVKKGIPVRLVADINAMPGCSKSIVIPDFGVRKTFRQGDNVVEFTPDKSGTFDFGCSMWMYVGKIVVEEADGSVAAFTGSAQQQPIRAGSCGGSGGGCGCGG